MVDAERLVAVLSRITARLVILDDYATQSADSLLEDRVRLGDLKYTFQTAIEACIDAAQHVVADQGLGVPTSNAAAFRSLSEVGIFDSDLATRMVGAVGFRNSSCMTTPRSTTPEWSPTSIISTTSGGS